LNHKNVKARVPEGMAASLQKIGVFMPEEVFLELVQNQTSRPPLGPVLAAHSNLTRIGALAGTPALRPEAGDRYLTCHLSRAPSRPHSCG